MPRKRRDYSDLLLWSAVLVTVIRYAGAFIASDLGHITGWVSDAISVGMAITGLGMGVLAVLGTAYIFDGWRRSMPAAGKRWPFRFKTLTLFLAGLLAIEMGILVPFTVSRIAHVPMTEVRVVSWDVWAWAALVVAAPFVLIGGIATGQASAFALPAAKHEDAQQASASMVEYAPEPVYSCEQCTETFTNWQAKAAHVRWQHSNGHKTGEKVEG